MSNDVYIRWRWNELILTTSKYFGIYIDTNFTDYYYDEILEPAYKDRPYHNLRHIESMLIHVNDFKGFTNKERSLLKWSIWFHDIVYDSTQSDNEEKSANQLVDFMRALDFEEEDIKVAKWLILVTTHKGSPQTKLEEIICDLDLFEFSLSERAQTNSKEVRQEFSHLSEAMWKGGRQLFLQTLLSKEYIYHTDLYRKTLEQPARSNIMKEIISIDNE